MFLVGGRVVHGIPPLHHAVEHAAAASGALSWPLTFLADALVGIGAGGLVLVAVSGAATHLVDASPLADDVARDGLEGWEEADDA